ncbi:MAG: Maf family nucleotide pyrophosphatase [Parvibaculaceae bacterium]|nr:Maf family nucleotide pyrophosphatase [Parvibaculaceae bacterium]
MSENRPLFVLASASPRRLDLLRQIGLVPDEVLAAGLDERPGKTEQPRPHAVRLAREKAQAVAALRPDALVLAADTVVACGRRILPKAEDEATARACLDLLGGRSHRVYTAVCLVNRGRVMERLSETRVVFRRLERADVDAYIASGEWRGKAGGYAIQGFAGSFVRLLTGSYSGVVGLPLFETASLLRGTGFPLYPSVAG